MHSTYSVLRHGTGTLLAGFSMDVATPVDPTDLIAVQAALAGRVGST